MATPDQSGWLCRERVVSVNRQTTPAVCVLANQINMRVPALLASYLAVGDEITFPIPTGDEIGGEVYIGKRAAFSGPLDDLYQVPIGYVTQPKLDKRNQHFVAAEVQQIALGISRILLPCEVLRGYFYRLPGATGKGAQPTFYDALRIPANASPAELRVAYSLRALELGKAPSSGRLALERAFNILGLPELRACYDALLSDRESPAIFPYGGFGSLFVSGHRSRDGQTFFANCILAFSPEQRHRRFHLPLRQCEFYEDRALGRDVRRKLELWLDPALLHALWDPTWNRWKHLLQTKIEVDCTFVQGGKYRKHGVRWELVRWETALPSRLTVQMPSDMEEQLRTAKATYHRFGQYSRALHQIRLCLEHRAIERTELEEMCSRLGIPGDIDVAQISWRPDYECFFYRQLSGRACRTYLFRGEYIFELEKGVVVETPQLGHATYVFAKPSGMENFLALYTRTAKEDIRCNRDNAGERLGFVGRVIHGTNPRVWLKEVRQRLGEKTDFTSSLSVVDSPTFRLALRQRAIGELSFSRDEH